MSGASAKRGEVWLVDLGYAAKVRPCLVLSIEAEDTDRALTTNVRFLKKGAFDAQNIVSISHAKLARKLGSLTDEQMEQVERAVKHWLGLL